MVLLEFPMQLCLPWIWHDLQMDQFPTDVVRLYNKNSGTATRQDKPYDRTYLYEYTKRSMGLALALGYHSFVLIWDKDNTHMRPMMRSSSTLSNTGNKQQMDDELFYRNETSFKKSMLKLHNHQIIDQGKVLVFSEAENCSNAILFMSINGDTV